MKKITKNMLNKTGLQPVSRPVEQIVGSKICSKNVQKTNGASLNDEKITFPSGVDQLLGVNQAWCQPAFKSNT